MLILFCIVEKLNFVLKLGETAGNVAFSNSNFYSTFRYIVFFLLQFEREIDRKRGKRVERGLKTRE
jgi:hypothetical protein